MDAAGHYPRVRMRRNRRSSWSRSLLAENRLHAHDLILPLFVHEGNEPRIPIPSMPDVYRYSLEALLDIVSEAAALGIQAIALFPVVPLDKKHESAIEAANSDNLICRAVRKLKASTPNIGIICDVALDPYTSHGHDGIVRDGEVVNDETVEHLCKQAVTLAKAGCDVVAPSDMMDGRVGRIRDELDQAGYTNVQILAYSVKYASSFYGPFRDAVGSGVSLGKSGKKSYQMDPANSKESIAEALLDVKEGADMLMVKPGLPYLDIIYQLTQELDIPVLAYHVSGEYAMLKAAAANGWLDEEATMMESLLSIKRAGARAILTYYALDAARCLLRNGEVCA